MHTHLACAKVMDPAISALMLVGVAYVSCQKGSGALSPRSLQLESPRSLQLEIT